MPDIQKFYSTAASHQTTGITFPAPYNSKWIDAILLAPKGRKSILSDILYNGGVKW